ncbi:uroporphyrinogen-III synthase [Marinobacter halodurans]|uniref:Uroporphyrinogen-III synthase n=1 Tax=Marinobacter halodurans TaxID=2528979 RepID=A0ABY1ZT18_9GAMM|nr:uroporphyrinogen-III synthase [Marinobacter halodurans]TBW58205.1 uroporphyrinogen-III synthase [Marinobacter halodurans]
MATRSTDRPLAGRRILICRPQPEADRLAGRLQDEGAQTYCLPLLERRPLPETPERRTRFQELDLYQHVIAVSPGAARLFLEQAEDWWPQWPVGLHWYGVGSGTADVLAQAGLVVTIPPDGFTSEHLLALETLRRPSGERVLIAKGRGGRELLGQTLAERGARVDNLELYERVCPDHDPDTVRAALKDFDPDAVIVLSGETLNNLIALGENTDQALKSRTLLVPVDRVAQTAREQGFTRVCIPEQLTPEGLIASLGRLD